MTDSTTKAISEALAKTRAEALREAMEALRSVKLSQEATAKRLADDGEYIAAAEHTHFARAQNFARGAILALIDQPTTPATSVTVPVEPSETMIDAIADQLKPTSPNLVQRFYKAREIYAAMIAARGKP